MDDDTTRTTAADRLDDAIGAVRPLGALERVFGSFEFFRLWIAQVVSATGDWLGLFATISLARRLSEESAGAVLNISEGAAISVVLASRVVPGLFLATAAGVIVDRLNRKRVMVCCDLGRAAVLVTLPFVDTLVGLVLASFLLELLTMLWQPAKEATVPNLVPRHRLTAANSLNVAAAYGMFPVAAGAAALLAKAAEALAGDGWVSTLRLHEEGLAFYVDSLSFLVTALIIWRIAIPVRSKRERRSAKRGSLDLGGAIRELRDGWRLVGADPIVRSVNVGLATGVMGAGMVVSLGAIFVRDVLSGTEADFNLVLFALGMGMALGVLAASAAQSRIRIESVFSACLIGAGVALIAASSVNRLSLVVSFAVVLGVLAGPIYVLGFTLLHTNVANEMRGRIFAALLVLVRLCLLIALAAAPLLSDLLDPLSERWWDGGITVLGGHLPVPGVRLTMWLAALIILAAGALATWSLRSGGQRPGDTRSGVDAPAARSGVDAPAARSGVDAPAARSGVDAPAARSGVEAPAARSGVEGPAPGSGVDAPQPRSGDDALVAP